MIATRFRFAFTFVNWPKSTWFALFIDNKEGIDIFIQKRLHLKLDGLIAVIQFLFFTVNWYLSIGSSLRVRELLCQCIASFADNLMQCERYLTYQFLCTQVMDLGLVICIEYLDHEPMGFFEVVVDFKFLYVFWV